MKIESRDILNNYFNLSIPSERLYSKGDPIEGKHGIEEISEEYYVSEYHLLKNGVAKDALKSELEKYNSENGQFGLSNKAKKENPDFHSWPKVTYSGTPNYAITKYKLSWLVEAFVYPKNKWAAEIDICRKYISDSAGARFKELVENESTSIDSKLNEIRVIMEAWVKSLGENELIPKYFINSEPVKVGETISFLSGNLTGNYIIHKESIYPEPVLIILNYLLSFGHKGSHDSDELSPLLRDGEFKRLQSSNTRLLADFIRWFKSCIDKNPSKNNWTSINPDEGVTGEVVKPNKMRKDLFLRTSHFEDIFIPYHVHRNKIQPGDAIRASIIGVWRTGPQVTKIN